jgi:sec-independent protein translocase protein TatC
VSTPDDSRMTFMEHLEELRRRVFRAFLALIAGISVGWTFYEKLYAWLVRPFEIAWYCQPRACTTGQFYRWMFRPKEFTQLFSTVPEAQRSTLHFSEPTGGFTTYFKVAVMGGIVFALPVIFYQLWSFIAPGLYPREKRLILPFVFGSTLFFVAGALFGYYLVFPIGYKWFLGFSGLIPGTSTTVRPTIMMGDYLDFTTNMLLAFGVVFELPLFIFFLALAGIVSGKQLFGFGRYFIVIAFVVAAVLTPSTDVYSQVMLAMPLVILYFVAAALALVFGPKEGRGFRKGLKSKAPNPDTTGKP